MKPNKHCSAGLRSSYRTFFFLKRITEDNHICKISNIAGHVDVSSKTVVRFPQNLGYYGRVARSKSFLGQANIKERKDWASEVAFWDTVIYTRVSRFGVGKSRFTAFRDNCRVWV